MSSTILHPHTSPSHTWCLCAFDFMKRNFHCRALGRAVRPTAGVECADHPISRRYGRGVPCSFRLVQLLAQGLELELGRHQCACRRPRPLPLCAFLRTRPLLLLLSSLPARLRVCLPGLALRAVGRYLTTHVRFAFLPSFARGGVRVWRDKSERHLALPCICQPARDPHQHSCSSMPASTSTSTSRP